MTGYQQWSTQSIGNTGSTYSYYKGIYFDASRIVPTDSENRPNNIALLPLIAY